MSNVIPISYEKPVLTVEEHIEKIQNCLEITKRSIIDTVIAIKECYDQVGSDTFQKEVATKLNMNPSTLNRWLSIGNSNFVMNNYDKLPGTFSGLYSLTQLEKKCKEYYPKDSDKKLVTMLDNKKITNNTENKTIKGYIDAIVNKIKKRDKKKREIDIVGLKEKEKSIESIPRVEVVSRSTDIQELIKENSLFRCIYVNLDREKISRWGDSGIFKKQIQSEFPLHELRLPSMSESVMCFIKVPMKKINVGIKVLEAFGFNYRDTFVPSYEINDFICLTNEDVIIRGERGRNKNLSSKTLKSSNIDDILDYCEDNFNGPFLTVFEETERVEWTCIQK